MPKTKKYQIVNARVDQASGGPDAAVLVTEVELKPATGAPFFYTIVECEGHPLFFETESSVFDWWMNSDEHETELDNLQVTGSVCDGMDYNELFENHKGIECYEGLRYLIYIMRASWDRTSTKSRFLSPTRKRNGKKGNKRISWLKKPGGLRAIGFLYSLIF